MIRPDGSTMTHLEAAKHMLEHPDEIYCREGVRATLAGLVAEVERAIEVADAETKGVYSKYMLEASDAIAGKMAQQFEISALREALSESRAAMYGAREVLGDIGDIGHAIGLADAALGPKP